MFVSFLQREQREYRGLSPTSGYLLSSFFFNKAHRHENFCDSQGGDTSYSDSVDSEHDWNRWRSLWWRKMRTVELRHCFTYRTTHFRCVSIRCTLRRYTKDQPCWWADAIGNEEIVAQMPLHWSAVCLVFTVGLIFLVCESVTWRRLASLYKLGVSWNFAFQKRYMIIKKAVVHAWVWSIINLTIRTPLTRTWIYVQSAAIVCDMRNIRKDLYCRLSSQHSFELNVWESRGFCDLQAVPFNSRLPSEAKR